MPKLLNRYATPFINGLFLVSLVSGIALFFHIGPSGFHGMHEWLSMVLIVPFVLHIWKNWKPMLCYFKRVPMAIALVASLAAAGVFLMPSSGEQTGRAGGPPQFRLARLVLNGTVADVAPIVGTDAETLLMQLGAQGFTVDGADQTLSAIAAASGKTDGDIAVALTSLN